MSYEEVNAFEENNRQKKVTALVAVLAPVLANAGCGPEILNDELWDLATKKAEVKPPSPITKFLVVQALGGGRAASQPVRPNGNSALSDSSSEAARPLTENSEDRPTSPEPAASSTPTLFDFALSREVTEQAIKQVGTHADPDWKLRALQAVRKVAERQTHFIVDDCWQYVEEPREPRAMGAVIANARRQGLIAPTSEYRPSARVTAHSNPRRVWRSLICQEVAS